MLKSSGIKSLRDLEDVMSKEKEATGSYVSQTALHSRADVDNCYDTVYRTGGSTASSAGGSSSASGSTLGTP
jgi:predicted small secreted protein